MLNLLAKNFGSHASFVLEGKLIRTPLGSRAPLPLSGRLYCAGSGQTSPSGSRRNRYRLGCRSFFAR